MPSRWFVPVRGVDPQRVRLEHVHAAFSAWFDGNSAEHAAGDKPYTISPLTQRGGRVGVIITTLNDYAVDRLHLGVQRQGGTVRLGNQARAVGRPQLIEAQSWRELSAVRDARQWTIQFLTPTTFRSGDRSSPMPSVPTIMAGLGRAWTMWCEDDEVRAIPQPTSVGALWVSDLKLHSSVLHLRRRDRDGVARTTSASGVTGTLTLRADDAETAQWANRLLGLAPYCGVGSMRGKGFGVVSVHESTSNGRRESA
jgi:CRISPR-associated endoribonuclease Cas6